MNIIVLSHWPHVRQLVAELVRQHVASVKALLYGLLFCCEMVARAAHRYARARSAAIIHLIE